MAWIHLYEENHPGVIVEMRVDTLARVQEAVVGGSVDIAALDQEPLPYYRGVLTPTQVAQEPIALVVHPGNTVASLSTVVLEEVLAGRIGDWEEVGGAGGPLQVYLLPDSAGVVRYLDQVVLADQGLAPQAIVCASTAALLRTVAGDPGAIGILPLNAVTSQVRLLGVDGLLPSDGGYPWRMPLLLSYGPAAPLQAREFVQYIVRQR
jgi:phosphate transport system substrate-binding protein